MNRLENFKIQIGIIICIEIIAVFTLYISGIEGINFLWMGLLLALNILIIIWIITKFQKDKEILDLDISRVLGHDTKDALIFGSVGIITYDEQYCATWVSDSLTDKGINLVGKKLTNWIGELSELFNDEVDIISASKDGHVYEISKKDSGNVLYVKDISEFSQLKLQYEEDSIVVGLLQLDNYMEIQQYEDEAKMALINTNLRQPLVTWADEHGMFIRRLRSDRFLVILNEKIYEEVLKEKFSILSVIRKKAEDIETSITLSISFARGTHDFGVLDDMVNDLLELAQSRGGDQVAVKKYGESVIYYGGNTESKEKRSKVRVRVMSQALKEAILEADRVFVVGHKNMDFDCMGAALCMSRIAQSYNKDTAIVSLSAGIELQLSDAMLLYQEELDERHTFISDQDAADEIKPNDLVIIVDHNNPGQCGAPLTLEQAVKIIVIDHHRRSADFVQSPLLIYVETGASSVSELACEFLPYQSNFVDLSECEATIMYVGILVDSNRFKMRTGSRTFEAAAYLRKLGVDPIAAENLLKEDLEDFEEKANILSFAKLYLKQFMIASVDDKVMCERTLMSQAADSLLNIKGIEASFVVARNDDHSVGISARSKGNTNVQIIMEKMNGGGHFSAAALQRENTSVSELEKELKIIIDSYMKEVKEDSDNESNTTE